MKTMQNKMAVHNGIKNYRCSDTSAEIQPYDEIIISSLIFTQLTWYRNFRLCMVIDLFFIKKNDQMRCLKRHKSHHNIQILLT